MKKTIKFVFLTIIFLCNHIEIKDNQLIAMEQENYNINNYTYDLL